MTTLDKNRFIVGAVDRRRPYLPEHLCPLAHTSIYQELAPAVRLRYNQLFASCYHEHFIFLESMLAGPILPVLIRRLAGDPIVPRLQRFHDEERMHTGWFHRLHQACEPQLYLNNYYYFVSAPRLAKRMFNAAARRPHVFPFVLWLAMMIEERTIPASREILRQASVLEPHFVTLHRLHATDEAGHVSLDGELIARLWPSLSPALKSLNRWLFVTLLREFFQVPKRAGWKVIRQLAVEFPELKSCLPRMRAEITRLGQSTDYLRLLYSRSREPRTFNLADRFREFRDLERDLLSVQKESLVL